MLKNHKYLLGLFLGSSNIYYSASINSSACDWNE
ncbi:hypothetical protein AC229_0057 [Oenococcus oeni]|nr:hypothetical protein AC229_0057 [Oenococcus oeni]